MSETKEVKELKEKLKVLEKENKELRTAPKEEQSKEPEVIKFKEGEKVADAKILKVEGKVEVEGEKQITFILLKKETRKEYNPEMHKIEFVPTGKIITTGDERKMTYSDFKDFIDRRITIGQTL